MPVQTAALTPAQIAAYHEIGYLAVEDVLPMADIAAARQAVVDFVERSRQATESDAIFDLEPGHTRDAPRLRRIKDPTKHDERFARLLHNERLIDIVAALFGTGVRFQVSKLNMKDAAFGSPVQWHQDWAFYPHTNDNLLAVGVALDDCTPENGCMLMAPGSHRGPIHDHHQDGVFVGAVHAGDLRDVLAEAVPVPVGAGGISLHHVRTLHGSAPNTSSLPRRLLLLQMTAIDAWPLSGVPDFAAWNELILRGEPTSEFRMERMAVKMPQPQPERRGSIYEIQTQLREDREVFARPT